MSIRFILAVAVLALVAGSAQAQTPVAAPAAQAVPQSAAPQASGTAPVAAAPAKAKAARTPESLKCSADADAQNLHGAARKTFRKKCMADARKAATVGKG